MVSWICRNYFVVGVNVKMRADDEISFVKVAGTLTQIFYTYVIIYKEIVTSFENVCSCS